MNIMFFISSMQGGGAEGVVVTLTRALAEKGHRVTLITNLKNQGYEIAANVILVDSRSWQYDTSRGSLAFRLCKKVANRFLDFINIRQIIKIEKPDIVLSFLIAWLWQLIILCKGRIPLVCAERNAMVYHHGHNNFITKQILYRMADVVQVMSLYDKAWVRDRYKKTVFMPNPLKFAPITIKEYDELFEKRKNILACGRMHEQKGFEKLIMAFSIIANDYPEWNIDICGKYSENDEYYKRLSKVISERGMTDRVSFIGFHSNIEVLMRSHSIFCLSSQHEGFPNVLSEAMANGMACISFDIITGPAEIIMDGLDGMIVENQKIEDLAKGLNELILNKDLRYTLGRHAIININRFNRDRVVMKWERFIENTVKAYVHKKN